SVGRGALGRAALGTAAFQFRIDPVGKAIPELGQGIFDTADIDDVVADTQDHTALAASMRRRISWTALGRPVNTASPIRKWPMLSCMISGIAAIGATVS